MAKPRYVESCEKCPFVRPVGHYCPVEWHCGCPGAPDGTKGFVASGSSGWWYKTPPAFCPLRTGVAFKVSKNIKVGE